MNFQNILEQKEVKTSVPCRVDFGGTLDISTFYLPLQHLNPATFNLALDLRTFVTLKPWKKGRIRISSKGFESAECDLDQIPLDHPMGLMFAVAGFYRAHGVHIDIESTSPPRSALGGSSAAAVAVCSALLTAMEKPIDPASVAWQIHYIESAVAGVPCGVQDQLAAAFGGANLWRWKMGKTGPVFERDPLACEEGGKDALGAHILVAYCGIPHESKDINGRWVRGFVKGENRQVFESVCALTNQFFEAMKDKDYQKAADLMNQETSLRCNMTPDVLDNTGKKLFERAKETGCGARFTGAGGGGCLWAIGPGGQISKLTLLWKEVLADIKDAKILETRIEKNGILVHNQ